MTSLFGLKKAIAAVPAVGALVILGAFSALANGSGAPVDSLQQCQDETGATCTNVQETSVIAVHRNNGPSVGDSQFATIITMNDLAPGNYVVTAKTILRSNTTSDRSARSPTRTARPRPTPIRDRCTPSDRWYTARSPSARGRPNGQSTGAEPARQFVVEHGDRRL